MLKSGLHVVCMSMFAVLTLEKQGLSSPSSQFVTSMSTFLQKEAFNSIFIWHKQPGSHNTDSGRLDKLAT